MRSNNTEMVEQNQMNDCNDNNNSDSRDTDQHVDKIRSNIDKNSNSIIRSDINNLLETKVDNNINTTANIVHSSVSQCECGLKFLTTKFLFYHRRDLCMLWVGHHNILTDSANCKLPSHMSTGLNSSNSIGKPGRPPKSDGISVRKPGRPPKSDGTSVRKPGRPRSSHKIQPSDDDGSILGNKYSSQSSLHDTSLYSESRSLPVPSNAVGIVSNHLTIILRLVIIIIITN